MPGGTVTRPPWYTITQGRIDAIGTPDTYGNSTIKKPDINFNLPSGYPITAILPGVVTNVDTSSYWGYAVTVKLDHPINDLATHYAVIHMGSVNVSPGQHISTDDRIGTSGAPSGFQQAGVGFALYPGDKYGYGPEWGVAQSNITGKLNPVPVVNNLAGIANSNYQQTGLYTGGGASTTTPYHEVCAAWDIPCLLRNLVNVGEAISVFLIAIIMIILGVYLMAERQVTGVAKKLIP